MKIVFTGGGSGGHFYPIIAIAEAFSNVLAKNNTQADLYYMAPEPYDSEILADVNLSYKKVPAGKHRRYFSLRNPIDMIKTLIGIIVALGKLLILYPDAVFAKGAYGSFPVLVAARILFIPVMIHESDTVPGRVNAWAGKFAKRVALSYAEAATYFPSDKVAHTGQPIRAGLEPVKKSNAYEELNIPADIPTLFIIGGSQGAQTINNAITRTLPQLVKNYYVIHQVGEANVAQVSEFARAILTNESLKHHYRVYGHMSRDELRVAGGAADLVISRAGSGLFEIAKWGLPSIIIPIASSNGDHQRSNAYTFARAGAATVIEENNLTENILVSEINRIIKNPDLQKTMKTATETFRHPDAAGLIANGLYTLARTHK